MFERINVPVLGFAAFSGTGKTTLLEKLIPLLKARGLRIGMVKHAHHDFDIDHPGKDSYRLRKAGASQVLVASRQRWALMVETEQHGEPRLDELLQKLDQDSLDLILVEGFKHIPFPRIELHRPELHKPLMFPDDPNIIAIATNSPITAHIPSLNIDDPAQIAAFILTKVANRQLY